MSRKTKRLEKDNLNLTRKHDVTNRNVLKMVDEREKLLEGWNRERTKIERENAKLRALCREMQKAGMASGLSATVANGIVDADKTDSEEDGEEVNGDDQAEDADGEGEGDAREEDEGTDSAEDPPVQTNGRA